MGKSNSSIKKVLLNSGVYSFTSILQKAIGFILLPLYTIYLTPEDYGITGIVNSFTTIVTLLFTLSLNSAVQRYYYVYSADKEKLKSFFGTIIIFVLMNSVIFSLIIIVFQEWLITPFIDGVNFFPYIFIGILTVVFNPIYTIYQSLLQTMQKGNIYAKNSLLYFSCMVGCNILFIVVFQWGATGQLLSYLFTGVIFGLYSFISLYKNNIISLNFNFSYLKEALNYSIPLLPHLMSPSIAAFISRLFLNNQVSTSSAGLFNIASQFMLVIDTLQISVNNAYVPWFYQEMNNNKGKKDKIVNFADMLSKGYLIISLAMSFFIKEIIQVFLPGNYLQAWILMPIMLVAYQMKSIYLFYVNTLFYNTKSTKYIFIASLFGSLINIFVSALLTEKLGLITPAFANLLQWFITAMIVIALSKRVEPVDFKLKKMVFYVLLMIVVIIIGQFYDFMHPYNEISIINIVYKIIILLITFLGLTYKDYPKVKVLINEMIAKRREK